MKKTIAILLAAVMTLSLAACGNSSESTAAQTTAAQTTAAETKAPDTSAAETTAPETTAAETEEATEPDSTEETPAAAPFEVGEDTAAYTVDGASSYAGTASANVKIVAGDDVLFNGVVTVTSDSLWVSEFLYAAVDELGISQTGIQEGFITAVGDYVSEGNNWWLWEYNGNNPTNFAVNQVHVFENDYILLTFVDTNEYFSSPAAGVAVKHNAFEVGEDTASYTVDGASSYAGTASVNVKIIAGEDELFNGVVTVTSDNLLASEFLYAAIDELGISQTGIQEGFITVIGDYACEGDYWWMWECNGNNPTNFAINDVHMFEGDYILLTFVNINEYYAF